MHFSSPAINSSSNTEEKPPADRMTDTFLKHKKLQSDARRTTTSERAVTQEMYFWTAANLSKQQNGGTNGRVPFRAGGFCSPQLLITIHCYAHYGPPSHKLSPVNAPAGSHAGGVRTPSDQPGVTRWACHSSGGHGSAPQRP